jgi:DNA invertase Pin-like site-specific DNA recombinase
MLYVNRVIGYARVSAAGQAESGLGLAAQRHAVEIEVERRGWTLVRWEEDAGLSGKALEGRPALLRALEALDAGEADTLVAAKLDRLSRSTRDLALLLERAQRGGWALTVCDAPVDTSSAVGEAMVGVVGVFAQLERRLIAERTRAALAEKKRSGARLGRPRTLSAEIEARVLALRDQGLGLTCIAARLNADGVATARGGKRWYASTVAAVVRSASLDRQALTASTAV